MYILNVTACGVQSSCCKSCTKNRKREAKTQLHGLSGTVLRAVLAGTVNKIRDYSEAVKPLELLDVRHIVPVLYWISTPSRVGMG